MSYLLDLLIQDGESTSDNSRYHLRVSLPGPLFERWCTINLNQPDGTTRASIEGSLLSVDLRPDSISEVSTFKDIKREFLRWFLGKLRGDYGGDVVTISK